MNTNSNAARVLDETVIGAGNAPIPEIENVEESAATIGDNKAPDITAYVPDFKSKADAVGGFIIAALGFRRSAEVLDSKFNQLCLSAADVAFYLWVSSNTDVSKREKPTRDTVDAFLKSVIAGDVTVVDVTDKETETVSKAIKYRTEKEKQAINEANKAQRAKFGDNFKPVADFTPAAESSLNMYRPAAAAAAVLLLFQNDKPNAKCELDGTSYRRVYRWIGSVIGKGGHKAGDVLMSADNSEPLAMTEECPKGAYEGIAYNDHLLHPKVQVALEASDEMDSEGEPIMVPVMKDRSKHPKYMHKPWVGATREAVIAHYERFFGKKEKGGVISFPTINPETGVKVEVPRTAGGTQSEGTETGGKLRPFDISGTDKSALFIAAKQAASGLPNREETAGLTDDAVTALIDLYAKLGEVLEAWGYAAEDSDFEEKVMTA